MPDDIIIALATGYNRSGAIAVIRISGAGCINIVNKFTSIDITKAKDHTIHLCTIHDNNNEIIDEVIIAVFFKNHSYTTEESLEISCHNSTYIITTIINTMTSAGMRLANPGEFTQRAFINGNMDLAQAEAVADIIVAKSKSAHNIALSQMKGLFSQKIETIKNDIIYIATQLELENDFTEEDIDIKSRHVIINKTINIIDTINTMINNFSRGEAIKHGLPIAIVGRPNVGKSSLLNRLLNEDRAIVSPFAGTTRDTIDAEANIGDIDCRFIDTAGIRDDYSDEIEKAGIERTMIAISKSQLVLLMIDITMQHCDYKKQLHEIRNKNKDILLIVNKIDLNPKYKISDDAIYISTKNNINIDQIKSYITNKYHLHEDEIIVNARHLKILNDVHVILQKILNDLDNNISSEFIMVNINESIELLSTITGKITSDNILNNIFSRFCIGK